MVADLLAHAAGLTAGGAFGQPVLALAGHGWDSGDTAQAVGLLACLIMSALANGAETALTSISRLRTRHLLDQGVKGSAIVADLTRDPNQFLSAILIVNSVAIIVASTLATLILVGLLGDSLGAVAAPIITSAVVLVFVEIIPKTLAIHTAEPTALRFARPVTALTTFLRPIISLLRSLTNLVMRLLGIKPRTGPFVTEDELISLVSLSEQQGVIEEDEKEMIHGVIEFEETMAREVMVPRVRITAVQADRTVKEAVDIALENGRSRIPVYAESIDKVTGIIYVKDLLKAFRDGQQDMQVRELARKAFEVPETKRVGDLFREFQAMKIHIAIVIDESGGTAGLVTIEDLLEEIVGEIQDEYDKPGSEPTIERTGPDEFVVDGRINLEDLDDEIDLELKSEDYDTLNGFIIDRLEELPTVGAEIQVDGQAVIKVLSVANRHADKVLIKRLARSTGDVEQEIPERTSRD